MRQKRCSFHSNLRDFEGLNSLWTRPLHHDEHGRFDQLRCVLLELGGAKVKFPADYGAKDSLKSYSIPATLHTYEYIYIYIYICIHTVHGQPNPKLQHKKNNGNKIAKVTFSLCSMPAGDPTAYLGLGCLAQSCDMNRFGQNFCILVALHWKKGIREVWPWVSIEIRSEVTQTSQHYIPIKIGLWQPALWIVTTLHTWSIMTTFAVPFAPYLLQ